MSFCISGGGSGSAKPWLVASMNRTMSIKIDADEEYTSMCKSKGGSGGERNTNVN